MQLISLTYREYNPWLRCKNYIWYPVASKYRITESVINHQHLPEVRPQIKTYTMPVKIHDLFHIIGTFINVEKIGIYVENLSEFLHGLNFCRERDITPIFYHRGLNLQNVENYNLQNLVCMEEYIDSEIIC